MNVVYRRFQEGDRVVRAAGGDNGRITVGSVGTVVGYFNPGVVVVRYDKWPKHEAKQREGNLDCWVDRVSETFAYRDVEHRARAAGVGAHPERMVQSSPTVSRVADAAFLRDGYAPAQALELQDRLKSEASTVKPPAPSARWQKRRAVSPPKPPLRPWATLARLLRML